MKLFIRLQKKKSNPKTGLVNLCLLYSYSIYYLLVWQDCCFSVWWLYVESCSFPVADSSLRGGYALYFLDDGEGMDPSECVK